MMPSGIRRAGSMDGRTARQKKKCESCPQYRQHKSSRDPAILLLPNSILQDDCRDDTFTFAYLGQRRRHDCIQT